MACMVRQDCVCIQSPVYMSVWENDTVHIVLMYSTKLHMTHPSHYQESCFHIVW